MWRHRVLVKYNVVALRVIAFLLFRPRHDLLRPLIAEASCWELMYGVGFVLVSLPALGTGFGLLSDSAAGGSSALQVEVVLSPITVLVVWSFERAQIVASLST
jgi:hypothetical protein